MVECGSFPNSAAQSIASVPMRLVQEEVCDVLIDTLSAGGHCLTSTHHHKSLPGSMLSPGLCILGHAHVCAGGHSDPTGK
jgi:hypothetical protein